VFAGGNDRLKITVTKTNEIASSIEHIDTSIVVLGCTFGKKFDENADEKLKRMEVMKFGR